MGLKINQIRTEADEEKARVEIVRLKAGWIGARAMALVFSPHRYRDGEVGRGDRARCRLCRQAWRDRRDDDPLDSRRATVRSQEAESAI